MDLLDAFAALPVGSSEAELPAASLVGPRQDFLAKGADGSPVFLLQDSSPASYSPAIELKNISIQFHSTCRVKTDIGVHEDQFAVVTCRAGAPELHEVFIRCLVAAVEQLPVKADTADLRRCVQSLLDLFRALSRPSGREVGGLWAELFLMSRSKDVAKALKAWHADQFERFDFSWPTGCIEVKATVKEERQHEFALEQLRSPIGGNGYIVSVLLQPLGGGVGILDLANAIERTVASEPALRQKLWENIAAALGSDFSERLDRRFDPSYAERNLAAYAMADVPAPGEPADPRITAVRFRADLSTVASSLTGNPIDVISTLIG